MDRIGLTGKDNNIASIKAKGRYGVVITLKTAGLPVHRCDAEPAVHRAQAHLVGLKDPATYTNSRPVGTGPFTVVTRFTTQDYVLNKNPRYWQRGLPEDQVPRVRPGGVERFSSRVDPERPGRLDAQLRPQRREGVRREGQEALPRLLFEPGLRDLARLRRHAVPVQPGPLPQGAEPGDRPQDRVEARRVRLRAAVRRARAERSVPEVGNRRRREEARQADGDVQPERGEEDAHRRRLHLQGRRPDRPEGEGRQARHPRHLRLVGLGRVEPDHHEEPA